MRKGLKVLLGLMIMVSITGIFASCELLFGGSDPDPEIVYEEVITEVVALDPEGTVVNALALASGTQYENPDGSAVDGTDTLVGATISVYRKDIYGEYSDTATDTAIVGSDGTYSFTDLYSGIYKVEGVKDGWSFVPREAFIASGTIPPVIAYPGADDKLVILLSWEEQLADYDYALDLDSYLTYYDGSGRDKVYYGVKTDDAGTITLDRDVNRTNISNGIPAIETITVDMDESLTPSYSNATGETDGINNDTLRFWVNKFSGDGSLTGLDGTGDTDKKSAYAKVDVLYMGYWAGSWDLPFNTDESTMSVLDIVVSDTNFTIKTNMVSVSSSSDIKSQSTELVVKD